MRKKTIREVVGLWLIGFRFTILRLYKLPEMWDDHYDMIIEDYARFTLFDRVWNSIAMGVHNVGWFMVFSVGNQSGRPPGLGEGCTLCGCNKDTDCQCNYGYLK